MSRLTHGQALHLLDLEEAEVVPWTEPAAEEAGRLVPLFAGPPGQACVQAAMPPDPVPALLEAARQEGFSAGEAAGRMAAETDREARAGAAMEAIGAALAGAAAEAHAVLDAAAEAVARMSVAALSAALPTLAARLAEAEVVEFTASLVPALAPDLRVELLVPEDLEPVIAERFAAQPRIEVIGEPGLAPGDATLRWRDGMAERRAALAREAVLGTIEAFMARLPGGRAGS
ncbi:FliH/SctL family protein [Roseicella aquatilis]|uniref:Flagellar assembly protein FliH/Type III secretion system HrpE domain-containing protein n=1 Tax=Roseicella aquatilis TaxID=2527868 RepID=A0A4R4DEQ3_9PROT|nr:hypothetical protein [Roseicella aquatilis]TCZ57981.1 hypothetical protein EXY23_17530 [Roseicella aquatilis]